MNGLILLVEDNEQILNGNARMLKWNDYKVMTALTLREARERMAEATPNAIVLDIIMPDGSGSDFMRELRRDSNIPVLLLTGLKTPKDIVCGLTEGGDDYLTKPYDFDVLLARIVALLRRASTVPDMIEKGALKLDVLGNKAYLNGEDMLLIQKEFSILLLFVQNEGKTLSAEYIYEKVWNAPIGNDKNALQNRISAIRKKLEEKDSDYTISSVYGKGYCFEII
jgi:DNA-binding response OmpR family regulator